MRFAPDRVSEVGKRHFQIANTAYPIHHSTTIAPYRVKESEVQDYIGKVWQGVDDILLYAHVPFCAHICAFCELSVVKPKYIATDTEMYFDALQKEISLYAKNFGTRKRVRGFDIGGGTPSMVDTKYIAGVMESIDKNFTLAEGMRISIETTPKIASEQ